MQPRGVHQGGRSVCSPMGEEMARSLWARSHLLLFIKQNTKQGKAQAECRCQMDWAVTMLSLFMLSIMVLSQGHHTRREERVGRLSSCPGKKEFRLGGGRHPLLIWPLTIFPVLRMSSTAWCSRVLLKPQTSPITTTLVLAQTHSWLGLKMTSSR